MANIVWERNFEITLLTGSLKHFLISKQIFKISFMFLFSCGFWLFSWIRSLILQRPRQHLHGNIQKFLFEGAKPLSYIPEFSKLKKKFLKNHVRLLVRVSKKMYNSVQNNQNLPHSWNGICPAFVYIYQAQKPDIYRCFCSSRVAGPIFMKKSDYFRDSVYNSKEIPWQLGFQTWWNSF